MTDIILAIAIPIFTLLYFVCLSVCLSVCPVPVQNSRTKSSRKLEMKMDKKVWPKKSNVNVGKPHRLATFFFLVKNQ